MYAFYLFCIYTPTHTIFWHIDYVCIFLCWCITWWCTGEDNRVCISVGRFTWCWWCLQSPCAFLVVVVGEVVCEQHGCVYLHMVVVVDKCINCVCMIKGTLLSRDAMWPQLPLTLLIYRRVPIKSTFQFKMSILIRSTKAQDSDGSRKLNCSCHSVWDMYK